LNESKQSCAAGEPRSELLVAKLARFYSVMGHSPEEPGSLALMAEMLTQSATDEEINGALTRCARECQYPVRIPHILQRVPGKEIPQLEAEARKAWDLVTTFVAKYVSNDVHGNYGPEHGSYSNFPKLGDRILDSVRRSGGWKTYKCAADKDFPFLQKRFFEEYGAWTAVGHVDPSTLLTEMPMLQLVTKSMDIPKPKLQAAPVARKIELKRVTEAPSPEQMRDLAAVQKQALVDWQTRQQRKSCEKARA
jgi:hypothetical protein